MLSQEPLPVEFAKLLRVLPGEESIGIVMRVENGGSLGKLIHGRNIIPIVDKIDMLFQIARGLAELHTVGIIHADIKPDNVLLDGSWPPKVRLADFGFSMFCNNKELSSTTLAKTSSFCGTPLYSAPEMMINPYKPAADGKYAKPSRKTDIYAFAILAYELLSQAEVFADVHSEAVLCARIHKGK